MFYRKTFNYVATGAVKVPISIVYLPSCCELRLGSFSFYCSLENLSYARYYLLFASRCKYLILLRKLVSYLIEYSFYIS